MSEARQPVRAAAACVWVLLVATTAQASIIEFGPTTAGDAKSAAAAASSAATSASPCAGSSLSAHYPGCTTMCLSSDPFVDAFAKPSSFLRHNTIVFGIVSAVRRIQTLELMADKPSPADAV